MVTISKSCIAIGDLVGLATLSASELLKISPRGAYTTARTFRQRSVFEFDGHCSRTAESAKLMLASSGTPDAFPGATDPKRLRPVLAASMRSALQPLIEDANSHGSRPHSPDVGPARAADMNQGEYKLTTVLVWGEAVKQAADVLLPRLQPPFASADGRPVASLQEGQTLLCPSGAWPSTLLITHATPLGPRRQPPVTAMVKGAPRTNAAAKDSEWVRQRVSLEASKPPDVEEILLMDESCGAILEGTQTNAYVIDRNGVVWTAEQGVLAGTVRRLVLEVCQAHGIPVRLEAPRLSDAASWRSAFISSTSRLVMPLDALQVPAEDGGTRTLQLDVGGTVRKIEEEVRKAVAGHSVDVFAEL